MHKRKHPDTHQRPEIHDNMHVIAVCCGQGFPVGMATTSRIQMIGAALLQSGAHFSVYHIGGSEFDNREPEGEWKGIAYRYFPKSTRRDPRRAPRLLKNAYGLFSALKHIHQVRRRQEQVVIYSCLSSWANWMLAIVAPVVDEISEWYPGRTDRSCWLRFGPVSGVVPISRAIEERVRSKMRPLRSRLPMLRVPILMDSQVGEARSPGPFFEAPYLLWAGSPWGEIRSHLDFLIQVLARVRQTVPECRLVLLGNFSEALKRQLEDETEQVAGNRAAIQVYGHLPREQMSRPMAGASALLAPLPSGIRWECCFPTKIGEYLASGRPVVSTQMGEVAEYLRDGQTAMLAAPDDLEGWSRRILLLLKDADLATRIGAAGRSLATQSFDYRVHSSRLKQFISLAARRGKRSRQTEEQLTQPLASPAFGGRPEGLCK